MFSEAASCRSRRRSRTEYRYRRSYGRWAPYRRWCKRRSPPSDSLRWRHTVRRRRHGNRQGAYFCALNVSIAFSICRSWPARKSARRIVHIAHPADTVILHVLARRREHARARRVYRRPVQQRERPGADHLPRGRHADQLCPGPSARKPSGNISASLAERSFCSTTIGPKNARSRAASLPASRARASPDTALR